MGTIVFKIIKWILISGILALSFMFFVFKGSFTLDYTIGKDAVYTTVTDNMELLLSAVDKIDQLDSDIKSIYITDKVPLCNSEYANISGVYVYKYSESTMCYSSYEDKLLEEVLNLKKIKCIFIDGDRIVFDCGGYGMIPSGISLGFYYFQDGLWSPDLGEGCEKVQKGKGWEWYQIYGDYHYYTEQIIDDFYYYKEW